jgi:hypothetical protein
MRDVEKRRLRSAGKVFSLDTSGILHRHIPASERHHAGTMYDVKVV